MFKKQKPAPADSEVVSEVDQPRTVEVDGARIVRGKSDGVSPPCLLFHGDQPRAGDTLVFTLDNGVTYTGQVADAYGVGSEVWVDFVNGIAPV